MNSSSPRKAALQSRTSTSKSAVPKTSPSGACEATLSAPKGKDLGALVNAAFAKADSVCVTGGGNVKTAIEISGAKSLRLGAGTYHLGAGIYLKGVGPTLRGEGYGNTILMGLSGLATSLVHINAWTDSYQISNLKFTRENPATKEGQNGIATYESNNHGLIEAVLIEKQFCGLSLGPTGYSTIQNLFVENNTSHGIFMSNRLHKAPLQYQLKNVLLNTNGGNGILAVPQSWTMSVGNWDHVAAFGNGGPAIQTVKVGDWMVESLRVTNSFFGNDAWKPHTQAEIVIDGGAGHQISNSFVELAGAHPTQGTYAESTAGIWLSPSVRSANLSNVVVNGCGGNGIDTRARLLNIVGSIISNNGLKKAGAATQAGISKGAGADVSVTGSRFVNDTATQLSDMIDENPASP